MHNKVLFLLFLVQPSFYVWTMETTKKNSNNSNDVYIYYPLFIRYRELNAFDCKKFLEGKKKGKKKFTFQYIAPEDVCTAVQPYVWQSYACYYAAIKVDPNKVFVHNGIYQRKKGVNSHYMKSKVLLRNYIAQTKQFKHMIMQQKKGTIVARDPLTSIPFVTTYTSPDVRDYLYINEICLNDIDEKSWEQGPSLAFPIPLTILLSNEKTDEKTKTREKTNNNRGNTRGLRSRGSRARRFIVRR